MWNFTKPQNANKTTDYKFETGPYSTKNGTLCTEIYRRNSTTTNSETLDRALETLTEKFSKNNYPKKLIESKIAEIRSRNFQKSESQKNKKLPYK